MDESETKHDKVLKRVQMWVAILGGILAIVAGVINFKSQLFPAKDSAKPAAEASTAAQKTALAPPSAQTGGVNIREYEWKGSAADFSVLDLDGNGIFNAQDVKGTGFENMDRNGDGSVERMEWRKSRRAFDLLDADGSGSVSRAEFAVHEKAVADLNGGGS